MALNILTTNGYSNIIQLQYERYLATKNFNKVIIKLENEQTNEIRALLELKNLPHIPQLIETYKLKNQIIIVIKFIPGNQLQDLIKDYNIDKKINIINALIKIVKTIHQYQWVHGDIHVGNIIVDDHLNVSLIDFGTAFKNNDECLYCPLYPPPESIQSINSKYDLNPSYKMNYKYDYWAL